MIAPSSILASVVAGAALATATHAEVPDCEREKFIVAIDIGHSSENPGSTSARGKHEYEFNREMAELLENGLHDAGFSGASTIEHAPTAPTFEDRVAVASERNADLLISIHHDSVQPRYLKKWVVDGVKLDYTDAFQGYSVFVSRRNDHSEESEGFGRLLGLSMLRHGFTPTLHHAEPIEGESRELVDAASGVYFFDDLLILRMAGMPAVLLECGVIKNRHEELFLRAPEFRERMTKAVVFAVDGYCSTAGKLDE